MIDDVSCIKKILKQSECDENGDGWREEDKIARMREISLLLSLCLARRMKKEQETHCKRKLRAEGQLVLSHSHVNNGAARAFGCYGMQRPCWQWLSLRHNDDTKM
jgi:hypothetical protein